MAKLYQKCCSKMVISIVHRVENVTKESIQPFDIINLNADPIHSSDVTSVLCDLNEPIPLSHTCISNIKLYKSYFCFCLSDLRSPLLCDFLMINKCFVFVFAVGVI